MLVQIFDSQVVNDYGKIILQLYGRNQQGQSTLIHVMGFRPAIYLHPRELVKPTDQYFLDRFREILFGENDREETLTWENKESAYGFHDGELFKMIKISFRSIGSYHQCVRTFKQEPKKKQVMKFLSELCQEVDLYDVEIDLLTKALNVTGFRSASWVDVTCTSKTQIAKNAQKSRCELELRVNLADQIRSVSIMVNNSQT